MMKPVICIVFTFLSLVIAIESCKKPHNTPTGGGKGGGATIIARADHAGALLDTAVVYIKYGTNDEPGDGVYDDSVIVATNYQGVFSNLTPGKYYLFTEGIHDPYSPPTVRGGEKLTIGTNNETDTLNIPTYQEVFQFPTWWHIVL